MFTDFINMIFPLYCLGCQKAIPRNSPVICLHCQHALPRTQYHLSSHHPLAEKLMGKLPLRYSLAYLRFTKQGKVQRLLHQLKYKGQQQVGELLGLWYGNELKSAGIADFDLIVPVPLHESKLRQRGYNQSDSFAKGLATGLSTEWEASVLLRKKASVSQTTQQRAERWQNVENIFAVEKPEKVHGKHVLLVDDVITTGATIESCAVPLMAAGCHSLSVAAIASA